MKKLLRVLSIVFVVSALALTIMACGQATRTEHDHQWSEWSTDTATCTQGGTQTRTCMREDCKTQDGKPATETRTTDALGHNVASWTLCESDHSKHEGVCSRTGCGVTVAEAHHANAAGTECVDCGTTLGGDEQCLHPNASATSETAATCTSAKIEHWTCPDCVWKEDRPVGTALGHDEYKTDQTAATCTTNKVEYLACHRCDWTDEKEIDDTALGHDYTDVAWTPVPGGTHERECARGCGDKQTETCDDDGVITGTAATCTAPGRENGTKCSVCGGNEVEGKVIDALGHAWEEWSEDTATCTVGGTQTRTCTREGCDTGDGQPAVDTRTTDALGHDEYITDQTAATCTTNKVEYLACHRCDWTDEKEIDDTALGHDYTDVAWTPVPGGTHERECARGCGDKQTGTCDDNGVITGTAATCTAPGRENGTKCSVCGGNEVEGDVIGALGHSLSVASTTPATCTASQVNHIACSRCDYTEDQTEGEALGHDFTGTTAVVVPDDATYHAIKCSRCDAFDVDNKHAAEWGEYGVTEDQTQHYRICKHCDVQSSPADHSATTYVYANGGEHRGECACGKALTEKCELTDGINACSVCGRIVGSVNSVGNFTIDFSTYGSSNIEPMRDIEIDGVTISFAKGSSSTNPRYWANDKGMRTYKGNSLTVTAPKGGKITSIGFTGSFSSDSAGYNNSSKTWTGSIETVTLNITASSNFTKMTIAFDSVVPCYHDDTVVSCLQSAASCEGTGILQDCYRCENCNLYFTTDACTEILENAVVDALGHNYGEWIDEVAATCAATGTKGHFRCDACGTDFDSEENGYAVLEDLTIGIDADNHSRLSAVAQQSPTCDNAGWNAHYACDGCGKKYETADATEEYDPEIAALGHDLKYRANGTDKHEQYCTRCNYVETAAEHTATTWVAEADGHHRVCTVCGLDFNEGAHNYVDGVCVCGMEEAHEHNYTGTVTKEPTCTEKGVTTYACDGCDNTYTEDIDALGHDFTGDVLPVTDDETHHAQKCSRCDAFDLDNKQTCDYTEETVDADGHHTTCVCGRIDSSTPHEYDAATQTCACGNINPTYLVVAGSDKTVATFEMGTGTGSATGSDNAKYSETASGYTLEITRESGNMYVNAGDGTNNVIRLAKSGSAASLSFEVPDDVSKVVIYVARYNASKAVQLTINGVNVDSPTGTAYVAVTVDTVSVKTILLGTDNYCYINTIEYWVADQDHVADPEQTPSVTAADCTNAGKVSFYCTTPGCTTLHEVTIPALGHTYGEWIDGIAATCVATGTKGHYHCDACGKDLDSEENGYAVLDSLTIAIDPYNHTGDLTHVDAKAATTCDVTDTEHAGHLEYWQCACGTKYADDSRDTVIDVLDLTYLDHTPVWTTLTDSGHSGKCSVCNANFAEEPHVWNQANTGCTTCGYEKPAGKHYVTTVIIVDGAQVAGIPTGVTLTWDPADANGAFDAEEIVTLEISLSGYNLVGVVVTDSTGNQAEDWMEVDGAYMGEMNDDYTLTITIETLYAITVNNENGATLAWYDENGETVSALTSATEGTKFKLDVTAKGTITVKVGDKTVVADEDGLYAFEVGSADLTIDVTVEVSEQTTTYQFGSNNSNASGAISNANLKSKFASAIQSGDTDVINSVSATNVYSTTANTDNLKFGSSSKLGSLTITFNSNVKVTKIVITAKMYGSDSSAINVNGDNSKTLGANAEELEFELDGEGNVTINITGKRGYIDSIVIYYEEV